MSHPELDNLISCSTRIFRREDSEYKANAYQYAKSSHDGMAPSVIVYPEGLQDILNIVDYAKRQRLGVAVRTGGHQYSGRFNFSSLKRPQPVVYDFRSILHLRREYSS